MIPRVIYYAWFGCNSLPTEAVKNIEGCKKLNPEFKIEKIDENNFDINKYSFTRKAYENKDWAFVSDVARLDIIYNNGGFYLDTDVELIKSLDSFIQCKSVWALENSDAINPGSFFGAMKKDEDIAKILDIYGHKDYESGSDDMIIVPIISNYFMQKGFKIQNKKQYLYNKTLILPTEFFTPFHYWGGGHITKNTVGIHHFKGSWQDDHFTIAFKIKKQLMFLWPRIYCKVRKISEKIRSCRSK